MTISECSKIVDAIIKMDVRRCKNNKKSKKKCKCVPKAYYTLGMFLGFRINLVSK